MQARKPIVAGQFYPAGRASCLSEVQQHLAECPPTKELPARIVAGIVPHAGWTFSGTLAAQVFAAVKQAHPDVDTFVVFGAIHSYYGDSAAVYHRGSWLTPLGDIAIDEELADAVTAASSVARPDPDAHSFEHSIEVQVPFIQHLFPSARLLPITVPPTSSAVQLGTDVADCITAAGARRIICIGSTDLTHYGPRYGFSPMGTGDAAIIWAKDVNDRHFIDLTLSAEPAKLLESAAQKHNACGAGAAAAAVAVAKSLGKTKGRLLSHTHSNEVMQRKFGQSSHESVGYAAIIF